MPPIKVLLLYLRAVARVVSGIVKSVRVVYIWAVESLIELNFPFFAVRPLFVRL